MKLIMLGAPGAGKGTQAKMLMEKYQIPHISPGESFRATRRAGTELGQTPQKYIEAGDLVPDDLTLALVMDRIAQDDCAGGYILDGFPRTLPQAEALEEALGAKGESVDYAVEIAVPDEAIVERMSGRRVCEACGASYNVTSNPPKKEGICDLCGGALIQREDDTPETGQNRLRGYHEQTHPLIDFYEKKGCLVTADGTRDVEDVLAQILTLVGQ